MVSLHFWLFKNTLIRFVTGLNASSPGESSPLSLDCRASPSPSNLFVSSASTTNFTQDPSTSTAKRARKNTKPPKLDECVPKAESPPNDQPTILFQLPQGTVYAPSESPQSLSPAPNLSANSKTEAHQVDSTDLFSATINGSSSSASSASPNAPNPDDQQQILNNILFNGANMQNIFDFMSRLSDSGNHK